MSAFWLANELTLRRNLLFQLLAGFDFDDLVFPIEPPSSPRTKHALAADCDTFMIVFEA